MSNFPLMTELQTDHDPAPPRRPLPVTITPGMPVADVADAMPATIAGITQEYCIYHITQTDSLAVARWRDIALANVCPAEPLLPADVTQRDRGNAQAAVLRELLSLRQFGLSALQTAALDELVALLCNDSPPAA